MTLTAGWRPGVVLTLSASSLRRTTTAPNVRRGAASMDGACSYDFVGRLGLQRTVWCGTSSEDGVSDYPSFLRSAMVLLLSVVVPHFHPYARVCVFFYSWLCHKFAHVLGFGVGLDLV